MSILETRQETWSSEAACQACAGRLASHPFIDRALITLRGTLGAGKTTFVRYLLRALGVQGPIKSPSYALVETYELAKLIVHHCDFYRLRDPREWEDAGIRDLLAGPGLKVIEWPEQAGEHWPAPDLEILIEPLAVLASEDASGGPMDDRQPRRVTLAAFSALGKALLT